MTIALVLCVTLVILGILAAVVIVGWRLLDKQSRDMALLLASHDLERNDLFAERRFLANRVVATTPREAGHLDAIDQGVLVEDQHPERIPVPHGLDGNY